LLYIFNGPDDFTIAQELDAIKKTAGDPSLLVTNTSTLDGGQVALDELRVACETVPFLSDKRLVVVYGLLERYAPRQPGRAARKVDSTPYETFGGLINGIPPSTILVLIENGLRESNPLFRLIIGKASVKACPLLKTPQLREWIGARIREEGGSISLAAISLLARMVGGNLWVMSSELRKLVLYVGERRIEENDVKTVVSYVQQASVFAMADAIVEFDLQRAETLLQQLLNEGDTPTQLLAMLSRQMRLVVRARDLRQQRVPESEIRSRLGLSADWLVRKTLEQAGRYTLPRIRQVYEQLLETDLAIKTGKYEGELALVILIAELCQTQKPVAQPQMQRVAI
jgi:DNA polymerase-3 subunit delta